MAVCQICDKKVQTGEMFLILIAELNELLSRIF